MVEMNRTCIVEIPENSEHQDVKGRNVIVIFQDNNNNKYDLTIIIPNFEGRKFSDFRDGCSSKEVTEALKKIKSSTPEAEEAYKIFVSHLNRR